MSQIEAMPPAAAEVPSRKTIRSWLLACSHRDTRRALALVALDLTLFVAAIGAVVMASRWPVKLGFGIVAGFVIGRLFILGHDACHQSLTPNRRLNRVLGRLVFLPSLTPFSLWEAGHNVVHHGYTNLKGIDFVWAPLTSAEYRALSPAAQWRERVYRSGWAPWLYYLVEIWWRRMFFPSAREMPTRRAVFFRDGLLVSAAATLWIAGLIVAARATHQPAWLVLVCGFLVPFLVWNGLIGFVVYVHHTHPRIIWHGDKTAWLRAQPFVTTTVHITFRRRWGVDAGALLHHIMEHTAHHVDMGIPLYHLRRAQEILEHRMPGRIVVQAFSWRWYFDTARRCKLYDCEARQWTDFAGRPTAPAASAAG
ncbi:MAG: fatty acid desaturase [Nevskiaceae bacterium]|nr:MAG: fatty acid desaturase [Nevskiaceae bacterium]